MNEQAVRARACEAGLAIDWVDALGRPQQVKTEALRRILDSLDVPLYGSDVRPLVTARVGARIELPGLATEVDTPAEVVLEDGSVRSVTIRGGKVATVPAIGEAGYHRLRFADREITLAVAPARCVTLEEVGAGRRMWGVAAQVYGLRRAGDGGIGDAGAVRDLAEAAARRGADAVALSPVHSLFAADPARHGPYSPSSRLFLNPLYGDPSIVFGPERLASHAAGADEQMPLIDWAAAGAAKFARLRRLFDDFTTRDLAVGTPLATDFERFVQAGGDALHEHALFEALHAERPGNWVDWPAGWRQGDAASVRYHLFLQWVAARSFAAAQTAARAAGMRIGLIGDLAIGMDRAGSHAWARQSDLLLGLSIGAPPDGFNPRGQDWGLTGFSPRALVARGFEPFLATLRAALAHAGGVRIDHIMGLMRLWLVPRGAPASEGAYLAYPLEDLLRLLALESQRHGAVVIGEDLGTVPPGFRARLRRAGIAGMDVMWFERTRLSYRKPARWRRDAVAMTTTHDLPTVAGWWSGEDIRTRRALGLGNASEEEERRQDRLRLWRAFTAAGAAQGASPPIDRPAAAVDAALGYVAQSPSPLMLAPLEDLLGLAAQPNLPGTIDEHPNWRRRLVPAAKDLFDVPEVEARARIIAGHRP
ncbi:MAG TPA: 4-alpha-glucanotransferase [Reyranella sp.]|jgi:4-alpha-glucanotransferase|nr:4-alpha-glucanotransferase [Reyranella sp.]